MILYEQVINLIDIVCELVLEERKDAVPLLDDIQPTSSTGFPILYATPVNRGASCRNQRR